MAKMNKDIVEKLQPKFYKCYVDDIINCPKKNQVDLLFNDLVNYHQNIDLTFRTKPKKVFKHQYRIPKWYLIRSL